MNQPKDIFDYIKQQEVQYAQEHEVVDNWNWCMKEHIKMSLLFKHGKFSASTNEMKYKAPNRNIILPLLNLRYRAEDIDVKDVTLYVNNPDKYHLSFLVKKYHDEVYAQEQHLDTFFDETTEEEIDYGGVLVRKGKDGPVYEPLESIAFCDQTDILSGPIGFKLFFSPDELYDMARFGWGDTKNGADTTLDELITLADESKQMDSQQAVKTKTPGKYIEVYRVHGMLPTSFLRDTKENSERYTRQLQIVAFYKNKEGQDTGVTLYKAEEDENKFKLFLSGKKIRNRALAYGGIEELFDPQTWTNYSEIKKRNVIDAVSNIVRWTDDESFASRNKTTDLDNNEILILAQGTRLGTMDTNAPNVALFNEWLNEWQAQAQSTSGATDALMGKNPSAGTPFRLEALVTQNGQALPDYRRGRYATFVAELYTDWIIPDIARKLQQGTTFLATLSPDEMEYVSDCIVRNQANKMIVDKILSGKIVDPSEVDIYKQQVREEFARGGNKKFIEILKEDFKDVELSVKVNVAGKQKDLAAITDKMVNIFRQVLSNPMVLQDPKAAKVFNKLIEYSGLDPIDFGYAKSDQPQQQPQMQPQPSPMQQLPEPNQPMV